MQPLQGPLPVISFWYKTVSSGKTLARFCTPGMHRWSSPWPQKLRDSVPPSVVCYLLPTDISCDFPFISLHSGGSHTSAVKIPRRLTILIAYAFMTLFWLEGEKKFFLSLQALHSPGEGPSESCMTEFSVINFKIKFSFL